MKKKENKNLISKDYKFNPDELPRPLPHEMAPDTIEVTTLDDTYRRYITHPMGPDYVYGSSELVWSSPYEPSALSMHDYYDEMKRKYEKKVDEEMDINEIKSSRQGEHIWSCQNKEDLTVDRVLRTLSAVKGRLMLDVAPIHIEKIECSITPEVRANIISASKKLKMYGKKKPIIARFDEYGNRLPDEIDISGTCDGILLKIVDPKEYGEIGRAHV